jgi:PAS domain S-box-containing protein
VGVLGGLVLIGWALDLPRLTSVLPGAVPMQPTTAVGLLLAAVPLGLRHDGNPSSRAAARAGATLAAAIGILTVGEYAFGWSLPVDRWLSRDAPDPTVHLGSPMAALTALGLVLLGLAELTLDHAPAAGVGQWLAVVLGYVGVLNLVGYAHQAQGFSRFSSPASAYTDMGLPTGVAFVLAAAAVLCARPERGLMAIVSSPTAGGVVARRLLPAALGLPLVLGWLRLIGEQAGLWDFRGGLGLLALSTVTLFAVIVWWSARALHQTDRQRQQVEAALRRARDDLETEVRQRTQDLRDTIQALGESERRYRELVDSSLGLICTHDFDGILLSINPAAARLLGYTGAELVGKSLRQVLAPAVRDLLPQYLERIRQGAIDEGVMRVVTRTGEERLWAYCNVRYEEPGRPPYVLGHAQDITALKHAEQLARQAQALKSVAELASAAAHEINNPLAVVAGHLEMLRRRLADDPDSSARLAKATAAVERMTEIVDSMARITRLERVDWAPDLPPLLDLRRSGPPAAGGETSPDDPTPPRDVHPRAP